MAFDASLGPETSQEAVFETVRPLVNDFLRGVNSTVFVYGMTGAGKTFTMLGPNGRVSLEPFDLSYQSLDHARTVDPLDGIVPRAIRDVFAHVEDCALDDEVSTTLSVTFMEIYNERIYDLLGSEQESRATGLGLSIHQDKARGVFVQDLSEVTVDSETEVFCLLARGLESRSVAGTVANDYSSRSHTIFQMTLETRRGGKVVQSKLNLVDLAGSEKWKTYGASGVAKRQNLNQKQIAELTSINQSLSTLGNCIAAVQSGRTHVPFRESSLTRLLHDSIGGNTRTMFIINLSPSHLSLEDTLSALKFAQRAKQVTVRPEVNHATDKHTVVQAQEQEIARLRKLLEEERSREPQQLHDAEQQEAAAEDLLAAREALVAVNARLVREQAERARVTSIFEKSMAVLTHHIDLATKEGPKQRHARAAVRNRNAARQQQGPRRSPGRRRGRPGRRGALGPPRAIPLLHQGPHERHARGHGRGRQDSPARAGPGQRAQRAARGTHAARGRDAGASDARGRRLRSGQAAA